MQSIAGELEEKGISVLAVSADTAEDLREHLHDKGFSFPLLSDHELKLIDAFGLRHEGGNPLGGDISRPALIMIGEDGQVEFHILTDNWRVRPTPRQILAKVESLDE